LGYTVYITNVVNHMLSIVLGHVTQISWTLNF